MIGAGKGIAVVVAVVILIVVAAAVCRTTIAHYLSQRCYIGSIAATAAAYQAILNITIGFIDGGGCGIRGRRHRLYG